MKTNELNQQEMQQTNGGTSMSPMQTPGADALTIKNNPETTPMDGSQGPETFGDWDRTDIVFDSPAS